MTTLTVFDRTGSEVGKYEFDESKLPDRINKQLLHDAVVMYLANRRQGSHKTKTRAEVKGSTKKMYRQKGTGNARAGSRRSGVRRGGGHINAIRNRDYSYRLPRKALRAATRMAIASKLQDEAVVVIDQLEFEEPRTKQMAEVLDALGLKGVSTLVTTAEHDPNVYRSARNISRVTVSPVEGLNALNVLSPRRLLVTKAALDTIQSGSAGQAAGADEAAAIPAAGGQDE